jgi:predicted site-specific integrase-resolvase
VARLFRVDAKTVVRWANQGKFPPGTVIVTPGGHRRFREDGVRARLNGTGGQP